MKSGRSKVAYAIVFFMVLVLIGVLHVTSNPVKAYESATMETRVTRSDIPYSLHADVVHEVSDLDLFIESNPLSSSGFHGHDETGQRYEHEYLEIMFTNNLAGTEQYVLRDTMEVDIIYENHTFEIFSLFGMVLKHDLVDVSTIRENIYETDYVGRERCSETETGAHYDHCIRIDLDERFVRHDAYQRTLLDGMGTSQVTIPIIVGYRVSYTAKLLHMHAGSSQEGPFGVRFEADHAFITNLGERRETEAFDF